MFVCGGLPKSGPGIAKIKKRILVPIDCMYQFIPRTGVVDYLCGHINKYMASLDGILLDFHVTKFKLKNKNTSPFSNHIQIKGSFTVFQPRAGDRLTGTVLEVRPSYLVCQTYDTFIVRVDAFGLKVMPGDEVEYQFEEILLDGALAIVLGSNPVSTDRIKTDDESFLYDTMEDIESDCTVGWTGPEHYEPELTNKQQMTPSSTSLKRKLDTPGSEPAVRKRTKPSEDSFGNLSGITPVETSIAKENPKVDPDLPPGWTRKMHKSEKCVWYTFISPAGKSFRNKGAMRAYLAAVNGEPAAAPRLADWLTTRVRDTLSLRKTRDDCKETTIRPRLKKRWEHEEASASTTAHVEDGDSLAHTRLVMEGTTTSANGLDEEDGEEEMPNAMEDTSRGLVSEEMRASLLSNLQDKLKKHKKHKKDKKRHLEPTNRF